MSKAHDDPAAVTRKVQRAMTAAVMRWVAALAASVSTVVAIWVG